jgi:hypothetical protein
MSSRLSHFGCDYPTYKSNLTVKKSFRRSPRSRFIDIYFVLYIAALVLVIPDQGTSKNDAAELVTSLLQTSFQLHVERPVLLCRVVRSGDSLTVLSCDSVNGIFHSGAMKNVRYDVSVEDQSYQTQYAINSHTTSQSSFFTLSGSADQGGVRFGWKPPLADKRNRLFRVNVSASATPVLPESLTEEQRESLRKLTGDPNDVVVKATTQFTVALVFVDGGGASMAASQPVSSQIAASGDTALARRYEELLRQFEQPRATIAPRGEFFLQPQENVLKMIANQPFVNRIRVYGADASREVEAIRVSGANAYARIEGSEIIVSGMAPQSGSVAITLGARRSTDKKDTSIVFRVVAGALDSPQIPNSMYPGVTYTFQPRLPEVSGMPAGAVLRDDRGNEVVRSTQGEAFTFIPRVEDTSRTFSFERSLNDRKIGQTYAIAIVPFPSPEIIDISMRNGQVWVRTRAYGLAQDAKSRVRLELLNSPAIRIQERLGDWSYDEQSHSHIQVFQFTAAAPTVSVRALNGRKQASERRDFVARSER